MKQSWKTRLTALMFSAAAIGVGALSVSCGVYGPPNVPEIDIPADRTDTPHVTELNDDDFAEITLSPEPETTEPETTEPETVSIPDAAIDLDAMTDDDFRNMTDEQLMAIGKQYTRLPVPAFCGTLPAGFPDRFSMTKKAAENQEEAFSLASEEFELKPDSIYEEKGGCYWLYEAGSGIAYWYLVPDKAFFDPEAQTLHADVTGENLLQLAAMRGILGERVLGAFVRDEGDKLTCTEYYLLYSGGDYGLSDTAVLYGFAFSADKETGQVTGFDSDQYFLSKEVEIPGTYHPYPDE
ncbi:MAG: hypothetical protein IKH27_06740 [Oscillospiraceae bacterium]|nr:hypothetical protein [Oscillospiraceae bacterium]